MRPRVKYKLPIMLMREGDYFVAYTPALDLSVQGRTKDQVRQRFGEVVQIFFEELERKGTTQEVLEDLGWIRQPQQAWQPPQLVDSVSEYEVPVPAFA
jgi:predicted RNase H-like HicB family nuclease